jgi:glycerophosphoryl diester phosphodiesterase
MMSRPTPEIIAHRGFSARAPENTLASLAAAIETGVESIEYDLQTAACGTPVLFHDPMLGRTTNGVGPLKRRPLAQLKALDAGSWFGTEFAGEKILTQAEALTDLRDRVYRVYQDIKGYREIEDLDRMVTNTRDAGRVESSVFISSDWVIMNRLQETAPDMVRAYLVDNADGFSDALDRAAVDEGSLLDVEIGVALSNPDRVQEAIQAGVEVMAWTVDDEAQASEAVALGITRLTTNEVERLLSWRMGVGLI